MKHPYTEAIVPAPDDGEPIAILRPELAVRVISGEGRSTLYTALLDTGADHIVFPGSVADELGITVQPATGPGSRTAGGDPLSLSFADLELALECDGKVLRWPARVFFNESAGQTDSLLLGHLDFLEHFTVTFIGDQCEFEIEPNQSLQSAALSVS